jgi:Trm5-related predicted tRNA methylase
VIVNISTNIKKTKEILNSDGQQFHKYQKNKESLKSDSQQFLHYQQNKRKFFDIGGIVDHHCFNFLLFC